MAFCWVIFIITKISWWWIKEIPAKCVIWMKDVIVLFFCWFFSSLNSSRLARFQGGRRKFTYALEIFKNFLASFSNSWEIVLSSCANSWELFWEYLVSSTLPWKCRISAFQGHNLILRRVNLPNLPYAAHTRKISGLNRSK